MNTEQHEFYCLKLKECPCSRSDPTVSDLPSFLDAGVTFCYPAGGFLSSIAHLIEQRSFIAVSTSWSSLNSIFGISITLTVYFGKYINKLKCHLYLTTLLGIVLINSYNLQFYKAARTNFTNFGEYYFGSRLDKSCIWNDVIENSCFQVWVLLC